jgi:hypothetical protein
MSESQVEKAQLIFLDAIERQNAAQVKQLKNVVTALEAVIAELQRPKKWKFDIDRNFDTKLIQKVTAEQVE